jgi:hypothetical protein
MQKERGDKVGFTKNVCCTEDVITWWLLFDTSSKNVNHWFFA